MKKPMTVLEALVINAAGWKTEEEGIVYLEARDVLFRAAREVFSNHQDAAPPPIPVIWAPPSQGDG